ncbi:MAG: glutamate--tRNA ligase [Alphaproteobacteria bacterium]
MPSTEAVITRFAPSPTGFLHIGGARTALFNWVYARHCGGRFLLRIEDTDRERSTPEAIGAILDGLKWLGLDWDEEPVYQSRRAERHQEVARELLEKGQAYRCYATREELEAMREKARAEGRTFRYDGLWRDRDPSEAPPDAPYAVRLKAPREGETVIRDHVQGDVAISNTELDDLVLLRSDGTPTYMLAVVVDDHDMGITHIVRGDDHLINAARQMLIFNALGWQVPEFAHVPLIHGPDGKKLSKRHGALGVDAYRDMGYLPAGLRNYLMRLGWGHGDHEIFTTEQAVEWFEIDAIKKSPARMDFAKLANINGHYIRTAEDEALLAELKAFIARTRGWRLDEGAERRLRRALPALKERAKTLDELAQSSYFLIASRPLDVDEKAAKALTPEGRSALSVAAGALGALRNWSPEALESGLREAAKESGLKFGQIAQPLRAALTGTTQAPGIFDVLAALGREESLGRIEDQMVDR